jgi:hypothetical protein
MNDKSSPLSTLYTRGMVNEPPITPGPQMCLHEARLPIAKINLQGIVRGCVGKWWHLLVLIVSDLISRKFGYRTRRCALLLGSLY